MIVICGGYNFIGSLMRVQHPQQNDLLLQPAGSPEAVSTDCKGSEYVGWVSGVLAVITMTFVEPFSYII